MRVYQDIELAEYADRVLPWLERDPVVNNVAAGVLSARRDGTVAIEPDAWWLRVHERTGELVGVAWRTPPRGLGLSLMPGEAARALADHCVSLDLYPPEVTGPAEASDAFADRYAERTGAARTEAMRQAIYRLDRVEAPAGVPGSIREAHAEDEELLIAWATAFHVEAAPGPIGDPAEPVRRRLGQRLVWVWQDTGRPVAMNWISPPVAGVVRVSGVYTPPELRGHGYASALVAATSHRALEAGATACSLYTDLSNPVSNRIYQLIGYHRVCDARTWRLSR
jgi:uncharacterized protein